MPDLTWTGLVKNRAKSGDYYWVRANVTPVPLADGWCRVHVGTNRALGGGKSALPRNCMPKSGPARSSCPPRWRQGSPLVNRAYFDALGAVGVAGGGVAMLLLAFGVGDGFVYGALGAMRYRH